MSLRPLRTRRCQSPKTCFGQRGSEIPVERHHHFRDAAFGGRNPARFGFETELAAQRRLDAVAIEQFAFDLRGLHRFVGHDVEHDAGAVLIAEVLHHANHDPGLLQETGLVHGQGFAVPAKIGPVRLLPIPLHEALIPLYNSPNSPL
jgi:hypothetical protein